MTNRPQDLGSSPTSAGGESVGQVVAALACAGVTAFVLVGIGFGRSTACTDDFSCSGAMCDPCRAITLTLALAHLANLVVCGLVVWLVLRRGGKWRVIAAQAFGLAALVVVVIFLTGRGVIWS